MSRGFKNINRSAAAPAEAQKDFPAMLERYKTEIARALPRHLNADRMARIALTAFRLNPKLAECDHRSIFAAVIQSSQLGLEVGLMGEAHLVPFKGQCQLILGYTGLMKLARQSGLIQDIYAHEVREKDRFVLRLGLERDLEHEPLAGPGGFPASDEERGEVVGFYAVAVFKDGTRTFVAMSRKEVERIRDNSRGYQMAKAMKMESVWDSDFVAMGLKTAIRRLCKYLPKSPELATALALDAVSESGQTQDLNVQDAIEGTYAPVVEDDARDASSAKPGSEQQPAMGDKPEAPAAPAVKAQDAGKGSRLDAAIRSMEQASTIEALMREYRRVKAKIEASS